MSKQFNNAAGTTSGEFSIGVGSTGVRHVSLIGICNGVDSDALIRGGQYLKVLGTEFYDLKFVATDQLGNRVAKQLRGTVTVGYGVNKIEDIFEEGFDGDIHLYLADDILMINCKIGSAAVATYNVYITLQRIE